MVGSLAKTVRNVLIIRPLGVVGTAVVTTFFTVLWNIAMFVIVRKRVVVNPIVPCFLPGRLS